MSRCVLCQKPVVIAPDVLSDGRLVHAECKKSLTQERVKRRDPDPPSGSRIRVVGPRRQTG